ncbi:MAG: hypothetical protein ACWA6X_02645 [Bauldia sp.]
MEMKEGWDPDVKKTWEENRARIIAGIADEYGSLDIKAKIENIIAIGPLPMAVTHYHSVILRQVRTSFVLGAYYPALIAACAAGERILNHLVIDLREYFKNTKEYKKVKTIHRLTDWNKAISILVSWKILLPDVIEPFRKLRRIRNQAVHFSLETYSKLRGHSLEAVLLIQQVVAKQFPGIGLAPWFIDGTPGAAFIRKDAECLPFIIVYYNNKCPHVTPYHSFEHDDKLGWMLFDRAPDAAESDISDEEFAKLYVDRRPTDMVPTSRPPQPGVVIYRWD